MKILKYIILLLLLSTPAWAASPWYVNCEDAGSTNQGTFAEPYNNATTYLDGQSFTAGDDIYFAQGTTCTVSDDIDIQHSGVDAANYSIIGCYEAEGDFDCSGARPIIQQSVANTAVFRLNNDNSYLRFQDLDIRNSSAGDAWEDVGGTGISTKSDGDGGNGDEGYLIVTNCNFYHHGHYALQLARMGNYNIITNNTFTENGNAIYFIDESAAGSSYNYVANNTCTDLIGYRGVDGHGVGFQRVSYSIVEDNTVTNGYNTPYVSGTWGDSTAIYNVFRRNKVYGSYSAGLMLGGGPNDCSYGQLAYQNISTDSSSGSPRGAFYFTNSEMTSIGNRMFNNTAYNALNGGVFLRAAASENVDYIYFKNNIVVLDNFTSGYDIFVRVEEKDPPGDVGDNFFCDYNLYWSLTGDPSAAVKWMDTNATAYNWADWKGRGNDGDPATLSDPLFFAPGSNDFTLQNGSPAVDAGGYLTNVAAASGSGTTITVADSYWFHGDYGLLDEDGNAITGMEITFYDTTNGLQQRTITSNTITHGTPGTFVVDASVIWIYDGTSAATKADPTKTTQVALKFYGTKPDIGAEEYALQVYDVSPTDGGSGISITASATWSCLFDDADLWLTQGLCSGLSECDGAPDSDDDASGTFPMATIINDAELTAFCLEFKANDGVLQGLCQRFDFTTTENQPTNPPSGLSIGSYHSSGLLGVHADQGTTVGE